MNQIYEFVDSLFKNIEKTTEVQTEQADMKTMLTETVEDLIREGKSYTTSVSLAIEQFGNPDEIRQSLEETYAFNSFLNGHEHIVNYLNQLSLEECSIIMSKLDIETSFFLFSSLSAEQKSDLISFLLQQQSNYVIEFLLRLSQQEKKRLFYEMEENTRSFIFQEVAAKQKKQYVLERVKLSLDTLDNLLYIDNFSLKKIVKTCSNQELSLLSFSLSSKTSHYLFSCLPLNRRIEIEDNRRTFTKEEQEEICLKFIKKVNEERKQGNLSMIFPSAMVIADKTYIPALNRAISQLITHFRNEEQKGKIVHIHLEHITKELEIIRETITSFGYAIMTQQEYELFQQYMLEQHQEMEDLIVELTKKDVSLLIQIGETGLARSKDLYDVNSKMWSIECLNKLCELNVLREEKIKVNKTTSLFVLTHLGNMLYQYITTKQAVPSEIFELSTSYSHLEVGYGVKDASSSFLNRGYTVYTNKEEKRFNLLNGSRLDFDLVIEKENKRCYIDLDFGTLSELEMYNRLNKIYECMELKQQDDEAVSLWFVVPNEQILYGYTKRHVFMWIKNELGGMEEVAGKLTLHFATLDQLEKSGTNTWEVLPL